MTTGPQHYRLAEDHIGYAQNSDAPDVEALHLGYAQAHATLALAAATAMSGAPGGMHAIDLEEWDRVCGAQEEYDAEDAIDASAPFAVQREQLAAADLSATQAVPVFGAAEALASTPLAVAFGAAQPEARGFELDDVVNVADPAHPDFATRGVVVTVRSDGMVTIMVDSRNGDVLTLPASSLMHHAEFVAQMDAADGLDGLGPEIASAVRSMRVIEAADRAAEDDAYADGYLAAVDDERATTGRRTLLECPVHGAAFYAGGDCPACAMAAAAAENGGAL